MGVSVFLSPRHSSIQLREEVPEGLLVHAAVCCEAQPRAKTAHLLRGEVMSVRDA